MVQFALQVTVYGRNVVESGEWRVESGEWRVESGAQGQIEKIEG